MHWKQAGSPAPVGSPLFCAPFPPTDSPAMRFFTLRMGPHDVLFSRLHTRSLVRLMSTCRRLRDLVLETCFNVHALLAVFFGDKVQQFRLMQWMTGTVVSGSVVLQYFNRFRWRGCDLDIYIHPGCAAGPIRFLLESGYTFAPRDPQYRDPFLQAARPYPAESLSYLGRGIADVLDFQNGDKKVQAIVTKHTPMETILGFHTTCVMNVLTYNHAFALYPRSTFIHKEALVIKTDGAKQESGRQKYVDRGWKMSGVPSLDNKSEVAVRLLRWPGDPFTWTLSLPEIPLRSTELVAVEPTDLCTTNSWQLDSCSGVVVTKWVRVEDASLRYKYIVADRDSVTAAVGKLPPPGQSKMDVALCKTITRHREGLLMADIRTA